jgi:hypothetical protein
MKTSIFLAVASAAFVSAAPTPAVLEARAPPNIPSKATATTELAGLKVAAQGSQTGYSRDLFPHWITQSGTCNTRETVLKRDGSGVVTDSACTSTSGSWYSTYDGATWTAASDVDIDHVSTSMYELHVRHTLTSYTHGLGRSPEQCLEGAFPILIPLPLHTDNITVRRRSLDHSPPSSLRQRLDQPPTHRRNRQRQPIQG